MVLFRMKLFVVWWVADESSSSCSFVPECLLRAIEILMRKFTLEEQRSRQQVRWIPWFLHYFAHRSESSFEGQRWGWYLGSWQGGECWQATIQPIQTRRWWQEEGTKQSILRHIRAKPRTTNCSRGIRDNSTRWCIPRNEGILPSEGQWIQRDPFELRQRLQKSKRNKLKSACVIWLWNSMWLINT